MYRTEITELVVFLIQFFAPLRFYLEGAVEIFFRFHCFYKDRNFLEEGRERDALDKISTNLSNTDCSHEQVVPSV